MNFRLVAFIAACLFILYHYRQKETISDRPNLSSSRLELLREWERRSFCLKRYNPVVYTKFSIRLKKFREYITSIERLKWHKLVRHKKMLPFLATEVVNLFHSMVHSIPLNRIEDFNQMLTELQGLVQVIARNTVMDFYDLCPQMRDRDQDYDINLTKDWFVHEYFNPKAYDPTVNYNYDYCA
jgi:hypothetical protein